MQSRGERRSFHQLKFDRLLDRIEALPTINTVVFASIFGAIVAGFHLATGPELSVSIFYIGPVTLVAWSLGRVPGLISAVVAAIVWFVADDWSGAMYSQPLIPVWNALVRLGFFAIIATMTASLHLIVRHYADEARVDELTGVLNRRGFTERASAEIERARRFERPLTLAFIDLDDFKSINDADGHATGDAVLAHVGSMARASLRSIDLIGRIGGDEFALLLPDTSVDEGNATLDRLRDRIGSIAGRQVTFSSGLVSFGHPPIDIDTALARADEVMYRAKQARSSAGGDTARTD